MGDRLIGGDVPIIPQSVLLPQQLNTGAADVLAPPAAAGVAAAQTSSEPAAPPPAQKEEAQQPEQQQPQQRCASCGAAAAPGRKLRKCAGCVEARYCNTSCQQSHWPAHQAECRLEQQRRRETASQG